MSEKPLILLPLPNCWSDETLVYSRHSFIHVKVGLHQNQLSSVGSSGNTTSLLAIGKLYSRLFWYTLTSRTKEMSSSNSLLTIYATCTVFIRIVSRTSNSSQPRIVAARSERAKNKSRLQIVAMVNYIHALRCRWALPNWRTNVRPMCTYIETQLSSGCQHNPRMAIWPPWK